MKLTSMMVVSMLAMPAVFAATNEADVAYYQVVKNDTLWRIAKSHGIGVDKLCELNGRKIGEPGWDLIKVGMRLHVPCAKAPSRISDDEAVALYSDALSAEFSEPSYDDTWVIFIDVDFDGVLEAVVGNIGGTARCSTTSMYCVSIGGQKAFQRRGMTKQNLQECMLACYRAFSYGNLPESRRVSTKSTEAQ